MIDGEVIPISITFTNSKGEVETYNNYNGKYAQPVYDNTPPTVSLNGDYEIHANLNGSYNEPGLTIDDNYLPEYATIKENIVYDSLTGRTKTVTDIDTSVEGKYSITYNVSDTANNETNVVRYVYIDNPIRLVTNIVYDNSVTGQVKVTVNANKVIKLPTGWTYVDENEKSIYKVYKESVDEKLIVYDLTGQSDAMVVNVVIEQSAPIYESLGIMKVKSSVDTSSSLYAKVGDTVRVLILFTEKLAVEPVVTIGSNQYTATYREASSTPANNRYWYMADYSVTSDMSEGEITFTVGEYANREGIVGETLTNSDINMTSYPSVTIDKTAPKVTFTYSNNNGLTLTNQDVTATLTASEEIQNVSSWTRVSETVFTRIFSANTKGSLTVLDLAGNSTKASYEVKRIDKTPPDITVKTGSTETIGDAENGYSKISFEIHDANGLASYAINDIVTGLTGSPKYSDVNYITTETQGAVVGNNVLKVTDKIGNVGTHTFKLIGETMPAVVSETRETSGNSVTVKLQINKEIIIPDGWEQGESNLIIVKTFTESFDGVVPLVDSTGNRTDYPLKVEISSGTVPANVIKVEYNIVGKDEATTYYVNKAESAGNIFISILLDKQLSNVPTFTISDIENHSLVLSGVFAGEKDNGYYYTATQAINSLSGFVDGEITFKISDIVDTDGNAVGDISEATNGSKIILDTVAPTVTFTYSNGNGATLTSGDVTTTLTANEQIQDITGWNRKTDNSLTKVFTKNTKGSLTVFDMAGNSTKASYEVRRIDKTPPDITIKTGSSETAGDATNGYSKISFKIHDSSGMVSWQINDGVVTKLNNASWSDINHLVVGQRGVIVGNNVLKVTDKVGNVGTKTFKMIGN